MTWRVRTSLAHYGTAFGRAEFACALPPEGRGEVFALRGANLQIMPGQIVGVLGESGSGKSTAGRVGAGTLPPNGTIDEGAVVFEGTNLLKLKTRRIGRSSRQPCCR